MRSFLSSALLIAATAFPVLAQAPSFDTSGDGMLKGTYYFRHVLHGISSGANQFGVAGDVNESIAVFGNINFDGNGNYTITGGTASDSSLGGAEPLSCYLSNTGTCTASTTVTGGTYAISSSGYGYLSNLITGDAIYGLVAANGIFSGSSTETQSSYVDMFIAAPLPSPLPTASSFNGSWTVMGYFPDGDLNFQINPNGSGSLGTVTVQGYTEGNGSTVVTQTANVTYTFQNGAAILTFPNNGTLLFGQLFLYFSPDGNFFFGGSSTTGYEMIVGVRNPSGTQNFQGLYYQSGFDQDTSQISSTGNTLIDSYYGSFTATSDGNIVAHQRLSGPLIGTYGFTFSDTFTPPVTGSYTDNAFAFQYAVSDNGAIRIGQGIAPYLALTVGFAAPSFTPTGSVYLNPTGIVNAASFSPFTAGVSNGEFITLFGNNLATGTTIASTVPYPTTLGGVQVMINGVAVPIYYVSQTQIAVIVPGADPYPLASIQVINGANSSNTVTVEKFPTTPGIYTIPFNGLGTVAAVHTNGQIVSTSNPAAPGEAIEVFGTGLGAVYPTVPDGAAPPTSPLSYTTNTITADVSGTDATVQFAGAAPTLAGLYQINVVIPSSLTAGTYYLGISSTDMSNNPLSYASQALLPVGNGVAATSARPMAAQARRATRVRGQSVHRTPPCFKGTSACSASNTSGAQ